MKKTKRLLVQTIPTVGAIGLASCSPIRGGGGGGGGSGGGDDIFGAWEIRFYGYLEDGEELGYEYPSSYTDEGCTTEWSLYMEIEEEGLEGAVTSARLGEGDCDEYYAEPYAVRYPFLAEELGENIIRIESEALSMDCPKEPGSNQMECTVGADSDYFMRLQRSSSNQIPEPTVDPGDDGPATR